MSTKIDGKPESLSTVLLISISMGRCVNFIEVSFKNSKKRKDKLFYEKKNNAEKDVVGLQLEKIGEEKSLYCLISEKLYTLFH